MFHCAIVLMCVRRTLVNITYLLTYFGNFMEPDGWNFAVGMTKTNNSSMDKVSGYDKTHCHSAFLQCHFELADFRS